MGEPLKRSVGSLRSYMDRKARLIFALSGLLPGLFLCLGLVTGEDKRVVGELYAISLPLVFPYALLALLASGDTYIPFAVLAIAQFPIYVLAWYRLRRNGLSRVAGWSLATIHLMAVMVAFIVFARSYGR